MTCGTSGAVTLPTLETWAAFFLRHHEIASVRMMESVIEQIPKRRSALKTVQKAGFIPIWAEPGAEAPPWY